jgi:hypothetical protein
VNDPETNPGFGVFSVSRRSFFLISLLILPQAILKGLANCLADPTNGQAIWNAAYSMAYVRLSLLGVNNINKLADCTKVLHNPSTSFPAK